MMIDPARNSNRIRRFLARKIASIQKSIDIDSEENMKRYVTKNYGCSNGLPIIDFLDILNNGNEEVINPYSFLEGTSPVLDIVLLKSLARNYDQCNYLEIGEWRGESIANVSGVAGQCISVSLSKDELRQAGASENFISNERFFSKNIQNVKRFGCNSQTFDFTPFRGKMDLIFIDGDHSYDGVRLDTEKAFTMLRNDESVIVWHDYGHSPETVRWPVLAGVLDGCPAGERSNLYHISNTLCCFFTRKKYPTRVASFPEKPNKTFSVQIKALRNE